MAKRITPPEEVKRVAERLKTAYGSKIGTEQEFNASYTKMLMQRESQMTENQKKFMSEVKQDYTKRYVAEAGLRKMYAEGGRVERAALQHRVYPLASKKKGKVVYSYEGVVRIKGRTFIRYRDRKGMFVSVKK